LKSTYAEHGIVIGMGAGTSLGCGLPTWKELLDRVAARTVGGEDAHLLKTLYADGWQEPAIAGVLARKCKTNDEFRERVREALYRDLPHSSRRGVDRSNHTDFAKFVRKTNSTLRAIAALCAVPGPGRTFAPNPAVHAILNFNLDSLLQAYVSARYRKRFIRTVERASAQRRSGKINTYHVHGYLLFGELAGSKSREADKLVLTENEYYESFGRPLQVFSYTFLHLLREHSCLFVGLSMTDQNLRRLLHYSYQERVEAYKEEEIDPPESELVRHFAIMQRSPSGLLNESRETSLRGLGVQILWIDKFDEIPKLLREVYESRKSSRGKWKLVF
jgi:hypothetical protein